MLSPRYAVTAVVFAGVLFAQYDTRSHRLRDDEKWAQKNEISAADVREMRIQVGILDSTVGAGILNVDAISLRHRRHVLLVEMGNGGHCMQLHVFERSDSGFRKIWSLTDTPETRWTVPGSATRQGRGICPKAPRRPEAYATADGRIVVDRPVMTDAFQRSIPVETYSFAWNGKEYALVE
jgi:hypothetical protein